MLEQCSRCHLEIPKHTPSTEERLCPPCYKKADGTCMRCGDEPVEVVEFRRVLGLVALGFFGRRILVLCPHCTRRIGVKNLLITGLVGWFGITPFFRSVKAQIVNLRSLYAHPSLPPASRPFVTLGAFLVPLVATIVIAVWLGTGTARSARDPFALPPDEARDLHAQGERELAAGRPELAAGLFRKALDRSPAFPPYHLALGTALERMGLLEDAEREYRAGLKGLAGTPYRELRQSLATLLLRTGRPAEAAALLRFEADQPENLTTEAAGLLLHRSFQDALEAADRRADAVAYYRTRLEASPADPILLYLAGRLDARHDPALARARFAKALEAEPGFFEPSFALGRILLDTGDAAAAERAFLEALEIRPSSRQAWFGLGEAKILQGDEEGALAAFGRIGALFPESPLGPLGRGMTAVWTGEPGAARESLEEAISSADAPFARAEAELWLAIALSLGSDPAAAAAHYELAVALAQDADQKARACLWAAEFRVRQGTGGDGALWEEARGSGGSRWPGLIAAFWSGGQDAPSFIADFEKSGHQARAGLARYFAGLKARETGSGEAQVLFDEARGRGPGLAARLADAVTR